MGSELADNFRPYILDVHIFTLFLKGYMLKISNNRTGVVRTWYSAGVGLYQARIRY